MKNTILHLGVALMLAGTLASCATDNTTPVVTSLAGTTYSAKTAMGQDSIATYSVTNDAGDVTEVGITFGAKALDSIQFNNPSGAPQGSTYMLMFPMNVPAPWKFAMVDWNPAGHPPGPYLVPHFDFHFYMQDMNSVMMIHDTVPDMTSFDTAKYLPAHYMSDHSVVPAMGVHWVDVTSPELNGSAFTKTFIYGTYHGNVSFMEPMITKAYLQSKPVAATTAIPQPAAWQQTGSYPTNYVVNYDAATNSYKIAFTGLVKH
jgi:hypothetical protein